MPSLPPSSTPPRSDFPVRVDFLGLQAFVSIAERGSFHAAATHLNLSQTALSHRIRKLEETLSTPLLLRTTRQVTLTPAGAALLPRARRLFDEISEAIVDVSASAAVGGDRVVLGCLPTIAMRILPGALAAFAKEYPLVTVRIHDSSATEIAERVQAGDIDFGVTVAAANRWNLEMIPVAKEPFVLVCHRSLPIAANGGAALSWADLQNVPLVRISAETGNRILIDDALGARREAMSWRYEVQRVTTAVSLVASGVGAAIVPQLAFDVADARDIVAIPLRSPVVTRALVIVTRRDAALAPAARRLMRLLADRLAARFASRETSRHE